MCYGSQNYSRNGCSIIILFDKFFNLLILCYFFFSEERSQRYTSSYRTCTKKKKNVPLIFFRDEKQINLFSQIGLCIFVYLSDDSLSSVNTVFFKFCRELVYFNTIFKLKCNRWPKDCRDKKKQDIDLILLRTTQIHQKKKKTTKKRREEEFIYLSILVLIQFIQLVIHLQLIMTHLHSKLSIILSCPTI